MIQLHWKNATAAVVGARHGVSPNDLDKIDEQISAAQATVSQQCREGRLGYAKLPTHAEYVRKVKELVSRYKEGTSDIVVLGIGGSALGNIALQQALNPSNFNLLSDRVRKAPRMFVLDNVDPALIADTFSMLVRRLPTTVFNVISKSGETAETASQFMVIREMLRKKIRGNFAERIVATTDANKGTLHTIAKQDGYAMLPVPDDVGGRFSVLSPVGLFPAAMCGIDIDALLAGAEQMRQKVENTPWRRNPACMLAVIKYLAMTAKKKPMHVMMPYSNRLYSMADWYRQLWAESLGKAENRDGETVHVGPTPIKALGTTDQHSQVQLYREGPNDKLTVFLEVEQHPRETRIPDVFREAPGLTYLRRKRMTRLITAEKYATEYAMAQSKRPTVTLRFPEISPATVGQFIYLYEYTTSLMGELMNINAYDQPAVELGKEGTFGYMKRDGYQKIGRRIRRFAKVDEAYLV